MLWQCNTTSQHEPKKKKEKEQRKGGCVTRVEKRKIKPLNWQPYLICESHLKLEIEY
jgi:hypothetical protein